ncbi:MAG TPA: STAS domain-containing protein [Acidimicrobiia bacterium]|jgi:anti-anti-sigma factor
MLGSVCDVEVIEDSAGPALVVVRGDLDDGSAARFEDALDEVSRNRRREVVVDLAGTGFLDTAGLTVLIGCARELEERGAQLVLQSPSRAVATVLDLTGTRRLFEIRSA